MPAGVNLKGLETHSPGQSAGPVDTTHPRPLDNAARHNNDASDQGTAAIESAASMDGTVQASTIQFGGGTRANNRETPPMTALEIQRDRTLRLLLKRLFEANVQRYLDARADHNEFFSVASPVSFHMSARRPAGLGPPENPWHFPAYEIFLDCSRLLCDHMSLYGLGQFLISGVHRGNGPHDSAQMQIIECFWRFQDAAVTYNVLCSLTRVLRWFMVDQVHGRETDDTGQPLPRRHNVDVDAAVRWAQEAQESATLVWFLFERAATALVDLFDANMRRDYALHCDAVHRIVRIFIHAADHPIVDFGLAEILVLYDLFLQETPEPRNTYATEMKIAHSHSFDRKFWAYKHPTFGQLVEADMYHEHLEGRSRIVLRQLDQPKDSWLLASDQDFNSLQQAKLDTLMQQAHALGKAPRAVLVDCHAEHFTTALKSDCDFALANAVETITELALLRLERYERFLDGVGFPLLTPLLEQLTELGESSTGLDDGADVEPALVLRLVVALWVNLAVTRDAATQGSDKLPWVKGTVIKGNMLSIRFLCVCLASNYDDIVEAACLLLVKYFAAPLSSSDRGSMIPLVIGRVVTMLNMRVRGRRTTHAGLLLLKDMLRFHSSFDVPMLPELMGLVAKVTAPVMLGSPSAHVPDDSAFSETWCPSAQLAGLDELCPQRRKWADERTTVAECIVQLMKRDANLLGACFVKHSGIQSLIGTVGKTRATHPDTARQCLVLLGKLVGMSKNIATALVVMNNAVMLLAVCANLGDTGIQDAAIHVINGVLQVLEADEAASEGGGGSSSHKADDATLLFNKEDSTPNQKTVAKQVLRMALEHDTAKCVIESMSMLMMTHNDKPLTALEYSFQDTLFFSRSFEKARAVMQQSGTELGEVEMATIFPSYLQDVDGKNDLLDEAGEARVTLCASCGVPEVDLPHRFCDVIGIFCSADCQKQHFDALRLGSSAYKMKANETLVSQALELQ
eukprot:m.196188 g.196188  ORF g.196188 m.196188 type:complete len:968 (-) comp19710_c0_seq1:136-3039(-)